MKQNIDQSDFKHRLSIELYNELLRPQQALNHFRKAIELLEREKNEYKNLANNQLQDQIRFHLEKSIFYEPNFVQAHYNLALLDYKQNALYQTQHHLRQVLIIQPNHFKANLMLCDLILEIGDLSDSKNLFDAIHCYTKLLNSTNDFNQDTVEKKDLRKFHESKDRINSSSNYLGDSKRTYKETHKDSIRRANKNSPLNSHPVSDASNNESTEKILTLARHNLCSVFDLINNQIKNPDATDLINIESIAKFCTVFHNLPTDSTLKHILFQMPTIRSN